MMVYRSSLATAGNLTTNATPNTETEAFFLKAGVRNAVFAALSMLGKGAGLTQLSGIVMRIIKWGIASTAGTGITPAPVDPGMQAAKATAASRPTSGTTRTNGLITGCSGTNLGGWTKPNMDAGLAIEGGGAFSISGMDASGTASMAYEFSFDHEE
jgi:hypothetical protein